jgi:hypothetical protein
MNQDNKLYPTLDDENRVQLYKQRSDKIISEIKRLKERSNHYSKVAKKWNTASKVLEGVSVTVLILGEISATAVASVITGGIALPAFIPIILSSASLAELGISKITKHILMDKRKEKYKKKAKLYDDYINRVWLYYERARQDGIISMEELEGFIKLVEELESKLESENNFDANLDMQSLRKQAELEVKREKNQEQLDRLKNEVRQRYNAVS